MAPSSKFVVVIFVTFYYSLTATDVSPCSQGPVPIFVNVTGCQKQPCLLVDGTDANIDIFFIVLNDSEVLKPRVRATVGFITVTYKLPADKQDGCQSLVNGSCPLKQGENVTYHVKMPIDGYSRVSVNIEFSLIGEEDEIFQCFGIACRVVSPPTILEIGDVEAGCCQTTTEVTNKAIDTVHLNNNTTLY